MLSGLVRVLLSIITGMDEIKTRNTGDTHLVHSYDRKAQSMLGKVQFVDGNHGKEPRDCGGRKKRDDGLIWLLCR
jgi:hypothetical protein